MAEQPYGLIATFDTAAGVYHAAESVRDAGYKNWDCITPYPVHGLDKAMGLKRSIVPMFSLAGGIAGVLSGLALIYFTADIDYKLIIAGRPFFSPIPSVPILVELGIALSAFSAVGGMIVLCRFPMLYHPVLKSDRIISALDDKYLIVIESRDPMFSPTQTKALLEKIGGLDVKELEA